MSVDGRPAVRLEGDIAQGAGRRTHLIYDVDPATYAPRRVVIRWSVGFDRKHIRTLTSISTITVERYEQLPRTPANERLLEIHPPAGTKIRVQTKEQVLAAGRRKARRSEAEGRRRAAEEATQRARQTPRP